MILQDNVHPLVTCSNLIHCQSTMQARLKVKVCCVKQKINETMVLFFSDKTFLVRKNNSTKNQLS